MSKIVFFELAWEQYQYWQNQDKKFIKKLNKLLTDIDRNGNTCSWAPMREVQRSALSLPGTGMVVSMDLGEDNDLHPLNKKDIGFRLAMQAAAKLYGLDAECEGPMIKSVSATCTDENSGNTCRKHHKNQRNAETGKGRRSKHCHPARNVLLPL